MSKLVYTVDEVAEILHLSRPIADQLVHSQEGPPLLRVGRCLRVPADGLQLWIERQSEKGAS